ncbi:hypothetical protein BJ912DRAFT_36721 [Pholiota molesta]|nr:hypothetical protein BJ912DRAFT_36721 [Pholiota molesta]
MRLGEERNLRGTYLGMAFVVFFSMMERLIRYAHNSFFFRGWVSFVCRLLGIPYYCIVFAVDLMSYFFYGCMLC